MGLAAVLAVLLLIQTLHKAYRPVGYDLTSYLLSAKALVEGSNPYMVDTSFPYIYPLFLAFVLVPLAMVPYWLANIVWFILSISGLLLSCIVLIRTAQSEIRTHLGRHLAVPGMLIFLVALSPIQNNLLNGQVNLLVLMCCTMFFVSFTRNRVTAGALWLAAAIALKVLPAVLLGFLLIRRRLRFAFLTVAFAILFCLSPGLISGKNLIVYYETYVNSFLLPKLAAVGGGQPNSFNLQSLLGYFTPQLGQAGWVRFLSFLVPLALVLAVDLRVKRSEHAQRHVWGFCAYLIGALLLCPMGQTHQLVLAIPAIALVVIRGTFDDDWMTTSTRIVMVCFVVSFVVVPKVLNAKPLHFISLTILIILLFLASREPSGTLVGPSETDQPG